MQAKITPEQVKSFLDKMQQATIFLDTEKTKNEEYKTIYNQLGAEALGLLILTVGSNAPFLPVVRNTLLNVGFSNEELNRLEKHFRSPAFAPILAQKAMSMNQLSPQAAQDYDNVQSQKSLAQLKSDFSKKSSVSRKQLLDLAKIVDKSECHFFVNPSASIRNSWHNNNRWERLCFAATQLSSTVKHADALSHYRWLAYARHEIANILEHRREGALFGLMRIDVLLHCGVVTGLQSYIEKDPGSRYEDQYDFCDQGLKAIENNKTASNIEKRMIKGLHGKEKPVWFILDPITKTPLLHIYRTTINGVSFIVINHADQVRTETIFKEVISALYQQSYACSDPIQILKNVARILWYLSYLAPLDAGSCAVNLMYVFDILQSKNVPVKRVDDKISPDFLAMFEPNPDIFVERVVNALMPQQTCSP